MSTQDDITHMPTPSWHDKPISSRPEFADEGDPRTRTTLLHTAVKLGKLGAATRLLHEGADVDAKDIFGFTALHWAADRGDLELIECLLRYRAKPNKRDAFGLSAMKIARQRSPTGAVQMLHNSDAQRRVRFTKDSDTEDRPAMAFRAPSYEKASRPGSAIVTRRPSSYQQWRARGNENDPKNFDSADAILGDTALLEFVGLTSDLPAHAVKRGIQTLVEGLYSELDNNTMNQEGLDRAVAALPRLLNAFASKLSIEIASREQEEVQAFVWAYRQ